MPVYEEINLMVWCHAKFIDKPSSSLSQARGKLREWIIIQHPHPTNVGSFLHVVTRVARNLSVLQNLVHWLANLKFFGVVSSVYARSASRHC